jgi:hypothetical protein
MKTPVILALVTLALGCTTPPPPSPAPSAPTSPAPPAGDTAQAPAPEQAPPSELPPGHEPPEDDRGGGGGRLAFIRCTPESRQVQGCTKELRPVCGHVDTGVRCVQPPCPSAEPRTFSNPCMACVEPKTVGYFPMSCEEINKPTAP